MHTISYPDFDKVIMLTGTIRTCVPNPKARKSAYKISIDFGPEWGIKISSAQITALYSPQDLISRQIIAVMNFLPKQIAGVKSEVLVLGLSDENDSVVLIGPERPVRNGTRLF